MKTLTRPNYAVWTFILLCIGVSIIAPAIPQLQLSPHAEKHSEVTVIRNICSYQKVYINKSLERLSLIKKLPDNTCAVHVIQYSCRKNIWLEITAYVFNWMGKSDLDTLDKVMKSKGCIQIFPEGE